MMQIQGIFKKTVDSDVFQFFIIGIILLAAVLVGLETSPEIVAKYHHILIVLDHLVLWIFMAEVVLKMLAEGNQPWRYFYNGWNIFDFIIVATFFLPLHSQYFIVLRMLRLLRVAKLLRALPQLQVLTNALFRSLPSMAYIGLLMFLLFYIYGVAATFLFAQNDPIHFATLPLAILSLFRVVTLEDWTDVMYIQIYGCDRYGYGGLEEFCVQPQAMPIVSVVFFVSFVLIGAMIVVNLFIGAISNSFTESQREQNLLNERVLELQEQELAESSKIESQLLTLQQQLDQMQSSLDKIRKFVQK